MLQIVLIVALLATAIGSTRAAAAPPQSALADQQGVLQWISSYRAHPDPERLPAAVRAMRGLGLFRDLEAAGVYVGFIAGVLGTNPQKAERLALRLFPMPPGDQVVVVRALAYSGLDDWKGILERLAERMPARKVLIRRHLDDKLPTLATLKLDTAPAALDANWGYYYATGRTEPIDRLVSALAWAKNGNDLDKLTAGSMAKWTLANNALQDPDLIAHLKASLSRQPAPVRIQLAEVIEAAETFETGRIRKAAQAAIEELKVKGPSSRRQFSFWGQAGQTALALGCVVAGALGHPEVAVPCVIGGAASSAAFKIFSPQ